METGDYHAHTHSDSARLLKRPYHRLVHLVCTCHANIHRLALHIASDES